MSSSNSKIKVLIVDDHRLLRDGLAALLSQADDIDIVGSVPSGEEAVSVSPSLKPDVILMDIMMSGMTGIEATRWIKEQDSNIKVILISSEIKKRACHCGDSVRYRRLPAERCRHERPWRRNPYCDEWRKVFQRGNNKSRF